MEQEFSSLSSEELIEWYHRTNSELRKYLLEGAPWNEQQERINTLTSISKELIRRRIELKRQMLSH